MTRVNIGKLSEHRVDSSVFHSYFVSIDSIIILIVTVYLSDRGN